MRSHLEFRSHAGAVASLGDAFGNMADAVIDGLMKIALQQMLIRPLGNLLFGGGEGGGVICLAPSYPALPN
ncbi:hypothetical protein C8J45_11811 [Sphingomonas sp. PP-CE-3G-477]|nr:hypothetical protein C8J45_11811 [Sphingomonas sp. PP-CE-3G-477]